MGFVYYQSNHSDSFARLIFNPTGTKIIFRAKALLYIDGLATACHIAHDKLHNFQSVVSLLQ